MLPLFKYFINTAVLAPLMVKHVLKYKLDYSQVLNILAIASVLNVLSNCRQEKCWTSKQIINGVFGFIAGVGFYYIIAVIFGAYMCKAYQSTFTWAVWMSSMTAYPLGLLYGLDFNRWFETVIRRNDHGSKDESRLICSIYSIWAGAWASSIVIPLDWDRAWQKWPIPNVIGALALCLATSIGFWIKDGCKCSCSCGNWSQCSWGICKGFCAKSEADAPMAADKTPRKAPATKATPVKAAAKASPAKSVTKASKTTPAKAASPTRKVPAKASSTRSRSPSKSPTKRPASPAVAAIVPSTPKTSARSRSKVATPSAGRASSRLSKRTRD